MAVPDNIAVMMAKARHFTEDVFCRLVIDSKSTIV